MTLEDTVGDIIRKARQSAQVSAEAAARAAGLSVPEFGSLEDTGKASREPDYAGVAKLVGLDGGKLKRMAEGWLSGDISLSAWRELRQITTARLRDDGELLFDLG